MKKVFAALCVLAFGCNQPSQTQEVNLLPGLATPIVLEPDTTWVVLADYFPTQPEVQSVTVPQPLEWSYSADSTKLILIQSRRRFEGLGSVQIRVKDRNYDIPLFESVKRMVGISLPANLGSEIEIKGEFTDWQVGRVRFEPKEKELYTRIPLSPGVYQYILVVDGKEMLDPTNDEQMANGMGGFNSVLRVGTGLEKPQLMASYDSAKLVLKGTGLSDVQVYLGNQLQETEYSVNGWQVKLSDQAGEGRTYLRAFGYGKGGRSNDVLIPMNGDEPVLNAGDLDRTDLHSQVMYFMMVDRFVDANSSNNYPVKDSTILPKANYYGGDLEGVKQKIEEGYFDELGVNSLWISPITQNPLDAWGQFTDPETRFSGYHGYWPITSTTVDFRFGSKNDLKNLLSEAHKGDMNVLLDYVANHVHQQHTVYQNNPDWVTSLYLPDGRMNTELWDEQRLTTWFDTFMPTLDLQNQQVTEFMVDSALYWVTEFEFDGFRHDATKHVPLNFWRTLTQKVKTEGVMERNQPIYQIGETYGSRELIASYVHTGMLDGQFDFGLYDAALAALGQGGSLADLAESWEQSLNVYGSHHLMGNISGNHDKPRFISFADGTLSPSTPWQEYKRIGWKQTIPIGDTVGYQRLALLHAFNMTIPGIPIIYYGDEIGMPGAGDPDNRRMMRFNDDLSERESRLLKEVSSLARARRNSMALMYGTTQLLHADDEVIAYTRTYFDDRQLIVLNVGETAFDLEELGLTGVSGQVDPISYVLVSF
jgi:glycosidase